MRQPLLLAPILLLAGTCGSVLQGYQPVGATELPNARWTITLEGVEIVTEQLVEGPDFAGLTLSITNRGRAALTLESIDLRVGENRRNWPAAGLKEIAPGTSAHVRASWTGRVGGSRASVVLHVKSPDPRDVTIEYQH